MKNFFKFLLTIVLSIAIIYIATAIFYFIFTGEFLGVISEEIPRNLFAFGTAVLIIILNIYFENSKSNYYK